MTATIGLVLDCADPTRLATFWSEALGYTTAGEAGNYVLLVPTDGGPPKLLLQAVTETKTTKNRMHLDIETPDVDAEVIRLESLGARPPRDGRAVRARFALGDHGRPGRQRILRLQRWLRLNRGERGKRSQLHVWTGCPSYLAAR